MYGRGAMVYRKAQKRKTERRSRTAGVQGIASTYLGPRRRGGLPQAQQGTLWPIPVQMLVPAPFGTADCKFVAIVGGGAKYVVKRAGDGPGIVLSEWLCGRLALDIGLAAPQISMLELQGGELCFGSRMVDAFPTVPVAQYLRSLTDPNPHRKELASWYAFDLFVNNIDRHLGNYLLTRPARELLGIDYSRAYSATAWPVPITPLKMCNTIQARNMLRGVDYCRKTALGTVARVLALPDSWMNRELSAVPSNWFHGNAQPRALDRWWRKARPKRLELLRRHLGNGRYLSIFRR